MFSAVIGVTIPVSRMTSTTPMSMFTLPQVPFLLERLPAHRIDVGDDTHAFLPSLFCTKHVRSHCRAEYRYQAHIERHIEECRESASDGVFAQSGEFYGCLGWHRGESFLFPPARFSNWCAFQIPPIPYFSHEEEDYFVERFSRQGFHHCMFFR